MSAVSLHSEVKWASKDSYHRTLGRARFFNQRACSICCKNIGLEDSKSVHENAQGKADARSSNFNSTFKNDDGSPWTLAMSGEKSEPMKFG